MSEPGVFTWTSPLGWTYLRDHTGSRATGRAWPETGVSTPLDHPLDRDSQPPDF